MMTTVRPALALYLLLTAAAGSGRAEDAADAIKGIWAVESMSFNGARVPDDPTGGAQLTAFDGKDYVQRKGQTIVEEGSYEVDPSKVPAAIDFVIKKGPDAGKRQLAIYELQGNALRVCASEPGSRKRPKSFDDASGCLLVVNKRFRP
jgi:uncharacterized protein (TIGR03067 family)